MVAQLLERLLHGHRRRRAGRRLARLRPRSVLVVCRGNLCRSPYAARRLEALLPPGLRQGIRVASAGFLAPGHHPPAPAVSASRHLGIDLAGHRSTQLTPELIQDADLVLVMEPEQQRAICSVQRRPPASTMLLGDFDPEPRSPRVIADPYGQAVEPLLECYRRIDRCVAEVAGILGATAADWLAPGAAREASGV